MKTFQCDACGNLVFFDNVSCLKCGHGLGFLASPEILKLCALEPAENGAWRPLGANADAQLYRRCQNGVEHGICNWMVAANDAEAFCAACRLNAMIPNLATPENLERWRKLEMAKRRVVYTLLRLGLPMEAGEDAPALCFKFLEDVPGQAPVMTGHENGLITLNIIEADDAERERRRVSLHEPYRTLLGHLRHEVSHYYWDRLIANGPLLERWRGVFGDERQDYAAALKAYYQNGPAADWQSRFVSAYASSHPWEDWAETCAHYFHIIDAVETAASFGMTLKPKHASANTMTADPMAVSNNDAGFDVLLKQWFPLTYALNSLNRGMGLPDLYPFVLSNPAVEKLRFVHEVTHSKRAAS